MSVQFGLWRDSACVALEFRPEGYACKVITDPASVSSELSQFPLNERARAIGIAGYCDHRAAWSIDQAKQLLAQRNIVDELTGFEGDTYPRCCVVHLPEGKYFATQDEKGGDLGIVRMII